MSACGLRREKGIGGEAVWWGHGFWRGWAWAGRGLVGRGSYDVVGRVGWGVTVLFSTVIITVVYLILYDPLKRANQCSPQNFIL